MSQDWHQDVLKFHKAFCPEQVGEKPAIVSLAIQELRRKLITEERDETVDAMIHGDLPGIADGLADLIYVALGTAIAYGIDLRPVWDEVQRSNLSKIDGAKREDGKVLKGPNYRPPDIAGILAAQGMEGGEG